MWVVVALRTERVFGSFTNETSAIRWARRRALQHFMVRKIEHVGE